MFKNNDVYLAGGYNMAINYPTFNNSYITDLDIYVNKEILKLYSEIKNIGNLIIIL